jgi:hypothetical protein
MSLLLIIGLDGAAASAPPVAASAATTSRRGAQSVIRFLFMTFLLDNFQINLK